MLRADSRNPVDKGGRMVDDERDTPGFLLPPPLTYLLTLVLGLVLDRRSHVPFLPRGVARILGWPLLGGGVLLNGWFNLTMRRADTPIDPRKPVSKLITEGPFRYTRKIGRASCRERV